MAGQFYRIRKPPSSKGSSKSTLVRILKNRKVCSVSSGIGNPWVTLSSLSHEVVMYASKLRIKGRIKLNSYSPALFYIQDIDSSQDRQ